MVPFLGRNNAGERLLPQPAGAQLQSMFSGIGTCECIMHMALSTTYTHTRARAHTYTHTQPVVSCPSRQTRHHITARQSWPLVRTSRFMPNTGGSPNRRRSVNYAQMTSPPRDRTRSRSVVHPRRARRPCATPRQRAAPALVPPPRVPARPMAGAESLAERCGAVPRDEHATRFQRSVG